MSTTLLPSSPTTGGLAELAAGAADQITFLQRAWLMSYRNPRTRATYEIASDQWFDWCRTWNIDPLRVVRAHIDAYQRWLETDDRDGAGIRKPRTISARLNALGSFYNYLLDEDVITRDPMRGVKRPKIERTSPSGWMTRTQLADVVTAAQQHLPPAELAAIYLLTFNGIRVGELCSLNVEHVSFDTRRGASLTFTRKGGKTGHQWLARLTEAAVVDAIAGRTSGPLVLNRYGNRLTRVNVQRMIDTCVADVRGITGRPTPHWFRHAWNTIGHQARVPADQMQHDGGWASSEFTLSYYNHGLGAAEKAATHSITSFILGVA